MKHFLKNIGVTKTARVCRVNIPEKKEVQEEEVELWQFGGQKVGISICNRVIAPVNTLGFQF